MILPTQRLTLRPIRADHAAALYKAPGDADVIYWEWPEHQSVDQVRDILAAHIPEPGDESIL